MRALSIAAAIFASSLTAAVMWSSEGLWFDKKDQKEVGIDALNTTAAMKSWVVCGFAEGFDWPDHAKSGAFRIGVLDDQDLLKFLLNNCNMNQYGSQIVEVSECPTAPDDSFYHILYVGDVQSNAWKQWKKTVEGEPTVVVTHDQGGIPDWAMVNFHFVSGVMKLELNNERAAALQIQLEMN
jgi:hypothetical protein